MRLSPILFTEINSKKQRDEGSFLRNKLNCRKALTTQIYEKLSFFVFPSVLISNEFNVLK